MEAKQKIITIAKSVIIHYIKQNYADKSNIDQEIERINKIVEGLDVSFENIVPGVSTRATNHGNGKITLRFKDKDNVTDEELIDKIETMVHEIYHSISKRETGNLFLEEGYVSYITAESLRYAIDHPIEIPEVATSELNGLLQKQELKNAYENPSEFVRSTQLVMEQYGIDSKYEYIFNGIDRLKELAYGINPEFGKMLELQDRKNVNSSNFLVEKSFFLKSFEQIDFSSVSPTLIEMNRLLQQYLIQSGEINKNRRLHDIVSEFNAEDVAYEEFYLQVKDLSDDQILTKVHSELPQFQIDYQIHGEIIEATKQMRNIAKMYNASSSPIKAATYGGMNFYSIMIAYDLIQRGIESPTEEEIMKYCNYLISDRQSEMLTVSKVLNYLEYVKTRSAEGKNLNQILNEDLANNTVLAVNMRRIQESELSDWEKADKAADLLLYQSESNKEDFYKFYYSELLKMFQQQIKSNHLYSMEDYDNYIDRMQEIFNKVQMPEVMRKIGYTPEMLFIKAISDNLETSSPYFPKQVSNLLDIMNERNPNLGIATGELDNLGFNISKAHEVLKDSKNVEQLQEFSRKLVIAYFNRGFDSILQRATEREFRKGNFTVPDRNIQKTVGSIISSPEFYENLNLIKDMFDKYPKMYEAIFHNNEFANMLVQQLPEELKVKFNTNSGGCIAISDINKVVLGCRVPVAEQFTPEKLSNIPPLVQFVIKYDTYQQLLKLNKSEEAHKIFEAGPVAVLTENKLVLDSGIVVAMAKKSEVQSCQPSAHSAFGEIEAGKTKEPEVKDIS